MPLPSDTPLLLELRSVSGAGKRWSSLLGTYNLTVDTREESLRQGLVYRKLHDGDNQWQFYLSRWEMRFYCTSHTFTFDKVLNAYFNCEIWGRAIS